MNDIERIERTTVGRRKTRERRIVRAPDGSSVHETQVLSCLLMGVELGVEVRYEVCGWMAVSN